MFSRKQLSDEEVVSLIKKQVFARNVDNISRTNAYFSFFLRHPEIKWAFLASMVSRNAGWNICDLYSPLFTSLLPRSKRKQLLLTYERANWLIFQDAYPQLLLYHYSTKMDRNLFHLLKKFHISDFMYTEWQHFYKSGGKDRLMNALIINEQHKIEEPVLKHPYYKRKVFRSPLFILQEKIQWNAVLFPTMRGELYGQNVTGFADKENRIDLGLRLARILFDSSLHPLFLAFAKKNEHTGSRHDYEKYKSGCKRDTPYLRVAVPIIEHHMESTDDWSASTRIREQWFREPPLKEPAAKTAWYEKRRRQLRLLYEWQQYRNREK